MPILYYLAPEPRYKSDAAESQYGEDEQEDDSGIQCLTQLRDAEKNVSKMLNYVSCLQDSTLNETAGTNLLKSMTDYSATGAIVPASVREKSIDRELRYWVSVQDWDQMKAVLAIDQLKGVPPLEVAVYRGDCKHCLLFITWFGQI